MGSCFDCLALTPFASLIATIVLAVGVGLFCGCGLYALEQTCSMFSSADVYLCDCDDGYDSNYDKTAEIVYWTIIGVTGFMGLWAIILLVLSFLSTFKAKSQVYGGEKVTCGGHICNSFFICLSYLLTLAWLVAAAFSVVPLVNILTLLASTYCIDGGVDTLDLTLFGIAFDEDFSTTDNPSCANNTEIKGSELTTFCKDAKDLQIWWALFFGACCLVVVGMIHFLMSMSANYAYVKSGLKKSDYEEKKYLEEQELNDLSTNYRSSDRIAPYGPY
ncbi:neuronal membrane glycoprotein M6-a-like [Glandiceps talaboti]